MSAQFFQRVTLHLRKPLPICKCMCQGQDRGAITTQDSLL